MKVSAISCASPFFEEIIGFYRVLYSWYLSFNVVRRIFAVSRDDVVDSRPPVPGLTFLHTAL